jgi:hypothetical protein
MKLTSDKTKKIVKTMTKVMGKSNKKMGEKMEEGMIGFITHSKAKKIDKNKFMTKGK